jgi:metal-responsive CopG/Arc/MetJ family transcriptional regulator
MRTIQITLGDDLVKAVDRVSKQFRTNRSAFTRKALREALARHKLEELELKHRKGYDFIPLVSMSFQFGKQSTLKNRTK